MSFKESQLCLLEKRFSRLSAWDSWAVPMIQIELWTDSDQFLQNNLIIAPRTVGAFQTGYIALRRALRSENNHGCHIEGSFQTEVLKTSHFKGPFVVKDFEGYNWWTLRAPMILCADSLHDDCASVWTRHNDAEGLFKKELFGPLHPSTLRSSHSGG